MPDASDTLALFIQLISQRAVTTIHQKAPTMVKIKATEEATTVVNIMGSKVIPQLRETRTNNESGNVKSGSSCAFGLRGLSSQLGLKFWNIPMERRTHGEL